MSVMMWDSNNVFKRADYSTFALTNQVTYNLSVGGFSSDSGWRVQDSLGPLNGVGFSAKDRDNDNDGVGNCSFFFNSAGWYILVLYYSTFFIWINIHQ
jgi:hypothetical protein